MARRVTPRKRRVRLKKHRKSKQRPKPTFYDYDPGYFYVTQKGVVIPQPRPTKNMKRKIEYFWNLEHTFCKGCGHRFNDHKMCMRCSFLIEHVIHDIILKAKKPKALADILSKLWKKDILITESYLGEFLDNLSNAGHITRIGKNRWR